MLAQIAAGGPAAGFAVTYSDLHPLWGGVTVALAGDGAYERVRRAPGGQPQALRGRVPAAHVAELAALLRELAAWEQRVPERMPVPDEGRATLRIRCGEATTVIWERYNDLAATGRMVRVRDRLLALGVSLAAAPPDPA